VDSGSAGARVRVSFDPAALERRRRIFEEASRATCPCCGYPTIAERGSFEICSLCAWEDDGQDDPAHRPAGVAPVDPEVVAGGPNHDYSLAEARRNFADNLTAYRPADIDFERERLATPVKREIVKAYERAVSGLTDVERAEDDARYYFARMYGI
jgi:hypothetical protein